MAGLGYGAVLQDRGGTEYCLAIFYKTDKFRLDWGECRSRALLVELSSVESDVVAHRVCGPVSEWVARGSCCARHAFLGVESVAQRTEDSLFFGPAAQPHP